MREAPDDADRSPIAVTPPAAVTGDTQRREILRLALPALGALVAQPLFVLLDAAIVGTLGTAQLAGLGAAATVVSLLLGLCVFLAYATTSSVARRVGEGRWADAVGEGIEGMSLGLGLGVVLGVAVVLLAPAAVGLLGTSPDVTPYAVTYLRVVALGFPGALAALAGVGVLRGLQDTRATLRVTVVAVALNAVLAVLLVLVLHRGVAGSAAATAVADWVQAAAYAVVLARVARVHGVRPRPSGLGMLGAARAGVPLFWRTVLLRAVYLLAAAVAARMGDADLAAYHVSFQFFMLLALTADALAIAGMALLGRYLGSGDVSLARAATGRLVRLGLGLGVVLALLLLAVAPWLPAAFSSDPVVRGLVTASLLVAAVQQPLAVPVFVLDGVLIGAGDARWLAGAGAVVLVAFAPAAYLVLAHDLGVVGLWWALGWFLLVRGALLGWRARGRAWLRPSAGATA